MTKSKPTFNYSLLLPRPIFVPHSQLFFLLPLSGAGGWGMRRLWSGYTRFSLPFLPLQTFLLL